MSSKLQEGIKKGREVLASLPNISLLQNPSNEDVQVLGNPLPTIEHAKIVEYKTNIQQKSEKQFLVIRSFNGFHALIASSGKNSLETSEAVANSKADVKIKQKSENHKNEIHFVNRVHPLIVPSGMDYSGPLARSKSESKTKIVK